MHCMTACMLHARLCAAWLQSQQARGGATAAPCARGCLHGGPRARRARRVRCFGAVPLGNFGSALLINQHSYEAGTKYGMRLIKGGKVVHTPVPRYIGIRQHRHHHRRCATLLTLLEAHKNIVLTHETVTSPSTNVHTPLHHGIYSIATTPPPPPSEKSRSKWVNLNAAL